jgi:hypothetical protein
MMKRISAIFLMLSLMFGCVLNFSGCGSPLWENEEALYGEKVEEFVTALDASDSDAMCALFSQTVRQLDKDLNQQIEKLLSVYPKGQSQQHWDGLCHGGYTQEDGLRTAAADATFPVVVDGEYFWIFLRYVYVDEINPDNVGLEQVRVYTAEEYCVYFSEGDFSDAGELGLMVHAELQLDTQVRCIQGCPYAFTSTDSLVDLSEAEAFILSNPDWDAFRMKFGQPNAVDTPWWYWYEVEAESGHRRYLEICAENGIIIYANVVGEFEWIRSILREA